MQVGGRGGKQLCRVLVLQHVYIYMWVQEAGTRKQHVKSGLRVYNISLGRLLVHVGPK